MKVSLIVLFLTISNFNLVPGENVSTKDEPQLVITSGTIKGKSVSFRGSKVYQFLGIPFAEPPLNDLRFKKPIPKKPWNGTIVVNKWGPQCVQNTNLDSGFDSGPNFDEDCLVLNVFTTQSAVKEIQQQVNGTGLRPVMVWIHPGGFNIGSANLPGLYDGTVLSALFDVILVTINYRLGSFGFLYAPELGVPGNMGLWDQQLALRWVKENIKNFGGDPNLVTIFGESAGSIAIAAHIVSPQSKGLFTNAIMQSGSIYDLDRWTVKSGKNFLSKKDCQLNNDSFACLSSFQHGKSQIFDNFTFWPRSGDEFLPFSPEEIVANHRIDSNINILMGTMEDEGALMLLNIDPLTFHPMNPINLTLNHAKYIFGKLFGKSSIDYYSDRYLANLSPDDSNNIRSAVTHAFGDTIITCPTLVFGHDLIKSGLTNLYVYYQSQRPSQSVITTARPTSWLPASHGDDVPMVFGHPLLHPDKFNVEDATLSLTMMNTWVTFAREGKPNPSIGQQKWSSWNNFSQPIMVFDSNRIGTILTQPVEFCVNNWPFPVEKQYSVSPNPGTFLTIDD